MVKQCLVPTLKQSPGMTYWEPTTKDMQIPENYRTVFRPLMLQLQLPRTWSNEETPPARTGVFLTRANSSQSVWISGRLRKPDNGPTSGRHVEFGGGSRRAAHVEDAVAGEHKMDEEVVQDGVKVLIDKKAQLSLLGTEMDFVENKLSAEFVFNNPNIKGTYKYGVKVFLCYRCAQRTSANLPPRKRIGSLGVVATG
ncbi:hypothetical protein pipiens_000340, partial [Culex pipiens pipiens]